MEHKFFVTGGVKREMDIADINGVYAILSKCIFTLSAGSTSTRARARARFIYRDKSKRAEPKYFYSFKARDEGFSGIKFKWNRESLRSGKDILWVPCPIQTANPASYFIRELRGYSCRVIVGAEPSEKEGIDC